MNLPAQGWLLTRGARMYRVLLRWYPAPFRQAYGTEMACVFRDRLRTELNEGGRWALVRFAARIGQDWPTSTVREQAA